MTDRNKRPDPQLVWQGTIPSLDPSGEHECRLVRVLLSQAELDEQDDGLPVAGRPHHWVLELRRQDAMGVLSWHAYEDLTREEDAPTAEEMLAEIVALLVREARGLRAVK